MSLYRYVRIFVYTHIYIYEYYHLYLAICISCLYHRLLIELAKNKSEIARKTKRPPDAPHFPFVFFHSSSPCSSMLSIDFSIRSVPHYACIVQCMFMHVQVQCNRNLTFQCHCTNERNKCQLRGGVAMKLFYLDGLIPSDLWLVTVYSLWITHFMWYLYHCESHDNDSAWLCIYIYMPYHCCIYADWEAAKVFMLYLYYVRVRHFFFKVEVFHILRFIAIYF